MDHLATLARSGDSFKVREGLTILDEAMAAGYVLEYSCRAGTCGNCKVKILSGRVHHSAQATALSERDVDDNYALSCCAYPDSDVALDVDYIPGLAAVPTLTLPCRVHALERAAHDVIRLWLRIPADSRFRFVPGQYLDLIRRGSRRSYSIAGMQGDLIELHIRYLPGGEFSEYLFAQSVIGDLLHFEGPFGTFVIRDWHYPVIFLAGGTGLAPILAMLKELLAGESETEIHVYWGARSAAGFYMNGLASLAAQHQRLHYQPVVSGGDTEWPGRRGLIHQAVIEDFADLSEFQVYACGPTGMIASAVAEFAALGLEEKRFYREQFLPSMNFANQ